MAGHLLHLDPNAAHGSFQELGNLSESEGHAMRLLDYGPAAKERARALLRKVHPHQRRMVHAMAAACFFSSRPV